MSTAESNAKPQTIDVVLTYGYIALWVFLSAAVILINKYILAYAGFPFPVGLTMTHMAFCSALTYALCKSRVVDVIQIDRSMYLRSVLPVAFLFSCTLWFGNAAYIHLSVSFIQMMKAVMPVTIFTAGLMFGTEKYSHMYFINIAVVAAGVLIATFGEINFHFLGVAFQVASIISESVRLCLIQILLQSRGIKLNPISTLYYIAPACFMFLLVPFVTLEAPAMLASETWIFPTGWMILSAVTAFALNMSVFLLIGKSSALTMNVAGVLKDWMLILLSIGLYGSTVTNQQFFGYTIAFLGVCWYNYNKVHAAKSKAAEAEEGETQPLLAQSK